MVWGGIGPILGGEVALTRMVQHEGCFCAPAVSRRSPARAAAGNGLTLLPARSEL